MAHTYLTCDPQDTGSPFDFDDPTKSFEFFALSMLARLIVTEECQFDNEKFSGLRIFCRLDISVFREQNTGKYQFFVDEVTRTHGAGLFKRWDTIRNTDFGFQGMEEVLHFVVNGKFYSEPPPHPQPWW